MAVNADQYQTILRYLDNELTDDEEDLFVSQMADDAELQKAFDTELILQQKYTSEETSAGEKERMFEPADEHIERIKTITEGGEIQNTEQPVSATVIPFYNAHKFRIAAAAILIIAAGFLIFNYNDKKSNLVKNNANKPSKESVGKKKDTNLFRHELPKDDKQLPEENLALDAIGKKFYLAYKGTSDDPAEASLYLDAYQHKKYNEVLNATVSDLETKGASDPDDEKVIVNYLQFYKSLSYLETSKPAKAAEMLKKILIENKYHNRLYYQTQWYLLMSYLKLNDKKDAKRLISAILSEKNHPERDKVSAIAKLLAANN